jgi:predicted nucleic acid-binding protein
MRLVIDTSALIAVVLNQTEKPEIIAVTTAAELIAPASVKWEVGNALSSLLKRKRITESEADEAIDQYNEIPIQYESPDLKTTLALCKKHQIYAYDAYVIACAQVFRIPILTLDLAMKSIGTKEKIKILEV